jgi:hypothetical protein
MRPAARIGFAIVVLPLLLPAPSRAGRPATPPEPYAPDPASVQRHGPAYRYPQAGWIVLHVEGEPYDRGYQHGRLLADEVADMVRSLASWRSPKAPSDGWRHLRVLTDALFLRRYDPEYLEEMKGIADGAAAGGARFDGRPLDLLDVATINSEVEIGCLEDALGATATGLEGRRFREPAEGPPRPRAEGHCSAFAATGPATADGKVVIGHITMWNLYHARHYNVWIDVKPTKGHRVLMQTYPGGIQSGLDYYMNDHGLVVCETTLDQTQFDVGGSALASRIRRALQYADSIDDAVKILGESNNGLYTNEWLLADANTNEIAMFELGTHKTRLWRSSKNQWFGGTEGFYWGCNNAKDLQVRLETEPSVESRPANPVFHPSDRDMAWVKLYQRHKGKIAAGFGFEAFTTPPLAAFPSLDAKFTTAAMARDLKTFALFGPPLGRIWEPSDDERRRLPDIQPLIPNDWALLRADAPAKSDAKPAADLASRRNAPARDHDPDATRPPAWRGTILPATDGDLWLAAAFADFEKVVALENALKARSGGELDESDRQRLALAMFGPTSRFLAALARRGGQDKDISLAEIKPDPASDEWYDIAEGKGVILLSRLRERMGGPAFDRLMDDFGRDHAGKPASSARFFEAARKAHGSDLSPLDRNGSGEDALSRLGGDVRARWESGHFWSIDSFERQPEETLIVFGTLKEADAQREAAALLQRKIARRWGNHTVPILADRDATEADLKGRHLLLIGRPDTNSVVARCAGSLPLAFGPGSFRLLGKTYAHPASAVIAAGPIPKAPVRSIVVFAGLGAEATWRCVQRLPDHRGGPSAEVLLLEAGAPPRPLTVPVGEPGRVALGR